VPLPQTPTSDDAVLELRDVSVSFDTNDGLVEAVRGVSLSVRRGETVAVVGESGSGKSQAMMAAMGLLASNGRASGSVLYRGRDILGLSKRELNRIRGHHVGMIFQEPMTSLDPLYKVGFQIAEPLMRHAGLDARRAAKRAVELLDLVQIPDPERRVKSYPHELSGGQRQRVVIARALASRPKLIIADEPIASLDVSIRAEILTLLKALVDDQGVGILYITHDLLSARMLADRVLVLSAGHLVESGDAQDVINHPQDDYTRRLLDAIPQPSRRTG